MAPKHKALTGSAFHDPNNTGPRETHDLRDGGLFSIYAATDISAPPRAVLDALLDVQNWPKWNTFVYSVTITSHPHPHSKNQRMVEGTNMIFHCQMTPSERTSSREACSHISPFRTRQDHPSRPVTYVRWDLHNAMLMIPAFLLKAQRVNEIEDLGEGRCRYRTWQSFAGWSAGNVRKKYEGPLKERFGDWCRDLKRYVEGMQGGEGAAEAAPRVNGGTTVQTAGSTA